MLSIAEYINLAIGNKQFLLIAEVLSFSCKLYLLSTLAYYTIQSSTLKKLFIFLIIFLCGALLNDLNYISLLIQHIFFCKEEIPLVTFVARIGWIFFITQHQALGLFLEHIIEKKVTFKTRDLFITVINIIISAGFLFLAFFKYNIRSDSVETLHFEITLVQTAYLCLIPLFIPIFYKIITKTRSQVLPKILRHQLKVFTYFLLIPHLFLEYIANQNTIFTFITGILPLNRFSLLSISVTFCSCTIYYCCKRIMGLRFLNVKPQVESKEKFNFIDNFKEILEQLSYVTTAQELDHITQTFFNAAFGIPVGRTRLYIRKTAHDAQDNTNNNCMGTYATTLKVENFILQYEHANTEHNSLLQQSKIFIKDEIEFTNFYEEHAQRSTVLSFLDSINSDVFLPIYERQTIIAYIIVDQNARPNILYNSTERDEMLVFTSYLSNIINILKHNNLEALLQNKKELQEELYHKHQEINQYKESIRSFLRTHNERKIGIIFYKNRKFTLANEAAQELIAIDINTNQGHPLAQSFKQIARRVEEYKAPQSICTRNNQANRLMICGIPSLETGTVIIMAYYPEVSDIINSQFNKLKDPSAWDYLLYLETTQSGQLINQLIPGTTETLLNFKINLLATALSKKATLLEMAQDDLMPTVEILHHISLRQTLHTLKLTGPEKNNEIALKLFGVNAIFNYKEPGESLLQKLNSVGTLFIENIHFLSLETQNALAEFIIYGYYHRLRSDHKVFSSVRIICSTTKNLTSLVAEGLFSRILYNELKKTSLVMPSLLTLPESEFAELAQGFTEQALKITTFKNLLQLSDKDKTKLLDQRPVSLQEFKTKVHQLLVQKSTKHNILDQTEFDPAYHVSDPELAQAVRLGKKALKDQYLMSMLWNKFKNQNKIATLLGVNRSSVNRRCQEYNLCESHDQN